MTQTIITFIIIAAAAVLLWRSLRRKSHGDCGCGCDDCPSRRDCCKPENKGGKSK